MCDNEITIKPKGCDFMNYKETVEKMMDLLEEKGVCSSSRKSHRNCYESLEAFLAKKGKPYSDELREQWLALIKEELPRQRYAVWEQYVYQLEEMDLTGTVSDRRLYLNRSNYNKLPDSWRCTLDLYLSDCRRRYTDRTLELTRIYCSEALLLLADIGANDIKDVTYDTIFSLMEMKMHCAEETRSCIFNYTARMIYFLAEKGMCSRNYPALFNCQIYPHIGRMSSFSKENRVVIEKSVEESMDFPADEFRESIGFFVETLEKHGYVGTTLYLARHALTALYLFLDIHSLGFHPGIMWAWFSEIKPSIGRSWLHWRRVLKCYEEYSILGDILPDGRYQYKPSSFELLPAWCRQAVGGFLGQKRRELRAEGTIRGYLYSCIRFCSFLAERGFESFAALSPEWVKEFARQDEHRTFAGRSGRFVIIRGFLRYLAENGYTDILHLDRCLMAGSAPQEKIVDVLTDGQIQRIDDFRKSNTGPVELRDAAMVLLGLRMGLRASDVLNLRFGDIDWKRREVSIVMEKTRAQITLPMPVDVGNAIYSYVRAGRPKTGSDVVFIRSKAPYGKLTGKVCTQALHRILPERKDVKGGGFHVTRRTFATILLRNHAGIDDVMDALGHCDPTSVMKYLLLDDDRSRECGLSLEEAGISLKGGLA